MLGDINQMQKDKYHIFFYLWNLREKSSRGPMIEEERDKGYGKEEGKRE